MRRARPPRGERDPLVVPFIPGSAPGPVDPVAPPAAPRVVAPVPVRSRLRVVGAVAILLAVIFVAGVLVSHGPRRAPAGSTVSTPAPVPFRHVAPKTTKQQVARAAAVKLAAKLPVDLGSAALIRVGKSIYVVGGKSRSGGKPTDTILRIALPSGRVGAAGHFIEPLADAGTARRGGFLYLAGGWTGAKIATAVLRWSPGAAATVVARLPVGLRSASAAFVGGRLYVAGGEPRAVYAVDVRSGNVIRVPRIPQQLGRQGTNLDYLAVAQAR